MNLYLYNTLTKNKKKFIPLTDGKVKMYVCGPTVYSAPHLGNALSVVVYDILYRVLVHIYGKKNVMYVRNLTDVDDKINAAAVKRKISIQELTAEITQIFHDDMDYLYCLSPNKEPKATEHIDGMIAMISKLIKSGHAYTNDGHVYFSVNKYKDYGRLSGRSLEDLVDGARIEVSESKQNAGDFVLWKPASDKDDPSSVFESPWGNGRPGWHVECSVMSTKYLGENFDIHGGGVDLLFPHHTNEIAQSCCANPNSIYANFWVHNGFLTVNGEKMSKSLGNFITVQDLRKKNILGEVIRYHLMSTNYRKPMDWSDKAVEDSKKALDSFYRAIDSAGVSKSKTTEEFPEGFMESLCDDLNIPDAYAILHDLVGKVNRASTKENKKEHAILLKNATTMLGLLNATPEEWFKGDEELDFDIDAKIQERVEAKKNKDWTLADKIRGELTAKGVVLEDKPDGSTEWRKG